MKIEFWGIFYVGVERRVKKEVEGRNIGKFNIMKVKGKRF